ncbi:MFS transporter [Thauera sinica]|uniref:CynX/NimT family MFS transporter n=1 Tax=Thauera sinica TaxID=2665146 RepID=A0ABW1AR62_9RHOO|nr:MFS transporter [Thauera sp. K11]
MTRSNPSRLQPAVIVILSGVVAAMHIGKIPPAIPVLREALGLSLVEAGFLLSMVQMAGMLIGVLAGLAADSIGVRRSIVAGQAILALSGFCAMWAARPFDLLALRGLEGLGFLLTVLPAPGLIRQLVPPARLALYLGLWGTYMGTGAALPLLGGPAIMEVVGWNGLWGLLGGLSAIAAVAVAFLVPPERQQPAPAPAPQADGEPWWERLRTTLTSPGPWRVAIIFAMYTSQWLAVIGFLPSVYAQAGISGQTAGSLTALACLINIVGSVAAGRLLHHGTCARHLLYAGFATMAATAFVAFTPLTAGAPVLRYAAALAFSAVGGLIPGTLFSLVVHVAPNARTVSTTVGWMQQCSAFGQFLGPPFVAWVAGRYGGWHLTWIVTGMASVAGLLLSRGVRFDRQ